MYLKISIAVCIEYFMQVDHSSYFSNDVLGELKSTKLIQLRRCRCNILFDVCGNGFHAKLKPSKSNELPNVIVHGHKTFETNPKNNKFFGLCQRCRQKQSLQKKNNIEHKKEVDKAYQSRPESKQRKREREQTLEYKAKKKIRQAEYIRRPEVKQKQKEYKRKYESTEKGKIKRNAYQRKQHHSNVTVRVRQNLSSRLNKLLRKCRDGKYTEKDTMKELGCSIDFFKEYIENQFEEGMTWENYGRPEGIPRELTWDLDHNTPARFSENGEEPTFEDILERSHYTNFQPMWAPDNQSKGNRFKGKLSTISH